MLLPAATELDDGVLVIASSAMVDKVTEFVAMAELFERIGSDVPELTSATSTIWVPHEVELFTLTANVKVPVPKAATFGFVQLMFPVPLTAGVVQVHPVGTVSDWNVVLVGIASVKTAFTAAIGPLLVTTCV